MPADDQNLEKRLEERITEFTLLSNGMHFIVLERHKAPIVSCNTYANVGAFDEEDGKTGALGLQQQSSCGIGRAEPCPVQGTSALRCQSRLYRACFGVSCPHAEFRMSYNASQ